MSKWIFFGSPLFGHTNPTLPVVSELVRRGERVTYFNTSRFKEAIVATGAEFRAYRTFPPIPASLSRRMWDAVPLIAGATEAVLLDEAESVRADPPDFVIYDFGAIWGAEIARMLGIPRVASHPTFPVNASVEALSAEIMPREIQLTWTSLRFKDLWMLWSSFRQRLRTSKRYGLDYKRIRELMVGDLNIVFTSSSIQPSADEFGHDYRFVGSPTIERQETGDFPFEKLRSDPLIYISMGTLFNDDPRFFEACFEALSDLDVQVVLSKGKTGLGTAPLKAPKNFLVCDYVPQIAILKRAAAFVTHGGVGSASEALHLGVPLVVIPQVSDGYLMAHQIQKYGAGILLRSPVEPDELRRAAERMLSDESFRDNSRRLGRTLVDAGGAVKAADEILDWARRSESRGP